MGFLGIGTWEILLIFILALIILGPGKLPEIARTLGKTVRAIRKAGAELTTAVTKELEATENNPPASQLKGESNPKTEGTPSTVDKDSTHPGDDQSTKPEGRQQQNE